MSAQTWLVVIVVSGRWRIPLITGVVIQVSAVRRWVVTFVIILSCILVILRAAAPILMRVAGVVLLTVATVHNVDNSLDCHLSFIS